MAGIDVYTKLYLEGGEADGSTTIIDWELAPTKTITCNGSAQADTAQSKFTSSSVLFDGTTDYLTTPDSDDFYFGTADFTIDFWVRYVDENQVDVYCGQRLDNNNQWLIYKNASNKLALLFQIGGVTKAGYDMTNAWLLSANTWYHLEFCRNSTTCLMFIDGVSQALDENNAFSTNDVGNIVSEFEIGSLHTLGDYSINGWVAGFRVSNGIARHTSNFTPPTDVYTLAGVGSTQAILL